MFATNRFLYLALLPIPLMIAASLWMLPSPLLLFVGAGFCLSMLAAVFFARTTRAILAATTTIAVALSVIIGNWPLRAAFAISRPALIEIASDVQHGHTLDAPTRVGLFTIQQAEIDRGVVCLWTRLRPNGRSGFVQCPPEDPPFNLWSHTALDESWQYIEED